VGCVIGFPHGSSTTESKRYEAELACQQGAVELDMVINSGKALSGDWEYVESDIRAVCEEAHRRGARVKVIFENDYLANGGAGLSSDELKIKLCRVPNVPVPTGSRLPRATVSSKAPTESTVTRARPSGT